ASPAGATACSILVRVVRRDNSNPLPGVALTLTGARNKTGITDKAGSFLFGGLTCLRNYNVVTSLAGFPFDPSSSPVISLKSSESINFTAKAFVTPIRFSAPPVLPALSASPALSVLTAPSGPRVCNPPPKSLPEIAFGQRQSDKTSWCEDGN